MQNLSTFFKPKDLIITDLSALQRVSKATSFAECDKLNIFNRLREASKRGWTKSYGLCAIQLGIKLSAFYYELEGKVVEAVNSQILERKQPFIARSEGCLSFPNVRIDTNRHKSLIVSGDFRITKNNETQLYMNQKFSLDNLEAHIFAHEYDHTIGKTIYDSRAIILPVKREFRKIGRNEICPLCSSGKKYKHCCMDIQEAQETLQSIESKI